MKIKNFFASVIVGATLLVFPGAALAATTYNCGTSPCMPFTGWTVEPGTGYVFWHNGDVNIQTIPSQYWFWKWKSVAYLLAAGCSLENYGSTTDNKHYIRQANCNGDTIYFRITSSTASYDGPLAVDGSSVLPYRDTACSAVGAKYRRMISMSDCSSNDCSSPTAPDDCYPVTIGASDVPVHDVVQYSQGLLRGPLGGTYTIRNFPANPSFTLSANTTNFCRPLAIPFSFFVNKSVITSAPTSTTITNISTAEAKMIFSGVVKDWSDLSAVDMTPQPVAVCMRHAGSGTHAAMDAFMRPQTVLKVAVGTATSTGYKVFFNDGGSDLLRCVNGSGTWNGAGAIGYADSDQSLTSYPNTTRISLDGVQPTAANVADYTYPFVSIANMYTSTYKASWDDVVRDLCIFVSQPSMISQENPNWSATCNMKHVKDSVFGGFWVNTSYHNSNCN